MRRLGFTELKLQCGTAELLAGRKCCGCGLLVPGSAWRIVSAWPVSAEWMMLGRPCSGKSGVSSLILALWSRMWTLGGFPGGSVVKNLPVSAGDTSSIPGSERSPGERNGYPRQYSCLENSMDRGVWKAPIPRAAESDMTGCTHTEAHSHSSWGWQPKTKELTGLVSREASLLGV